MVYCSSGKHRSPMISIFFQRVNIAEFMVIDEIMVIGSDSNLGWIHQRDLSLEAC